MRQRNSAMDLGMFEMTAFLHHEDQVPASQTSAIEEPRPPGRLGDTCDKRLQPM